MAGTVSRCDVAAESQAVGRLTRGSSLNSRALRPQIVEQLARCFERRVGGDAEFAVDILNLYVEFEAYCQRASFERLIHLSTAAGTLATRERFASSSTVTRAPLPVHSHRDACRVERRATSQLPELLTLAVVEAVPGARGESGAGRTTV